MEPFTLSWFIANFLIIWIAYGVIRAAWKSVGVTKLSRTVGLRIGRFLRGKGGIGLAIGLVAMALTVVAFFIPWYSVTASPPSESPPGSAPLQLISLGGTKGFNVSLFSNQTGTVYSLPLTKIVSVNAPFAVMFAVGIPLLLIDVVGVTRGSRLGRKFVDGGIVLIFCLVLIYVWFSLLPNDVPVTSSLLGGTSVAAPESQLLSAISANAVSGSMPIVTAGGSSTISWGFGLGAYLLLAAAVLRFIAGGVMSLVPSLAPPAPTPIPQLTPAGPEPTRRLAAIMFTDIVGYTAMTQANESRAMNLLEKHRKLLRPIFPKHSGREVKTIGDAFLVEFHSALEATECAVEMQKTLHDYVEPAEDKVKLKIGIHVGDVIHKDGDVYGDAVNIASRIEPLAVGGGICISEQVYDQVRNKIPYRLVRLQPKELKNVAFQIDTYLVQLPWEAPPPPPNPPPTTSQPPR